MILGFLLLSLVAAEPIPWRMFQFDAQHTGYYPAPLYPPLELKWTYKSDYNDFTMLSASVGNGMLYVGNGLHILLALDVETGEVIWEKELTSNVWTTALAPGDSLLFAGTSISFDFTKPTFFCLDPITGEIKWSKAIHTVTFQPVPLESIIYVSNLQGDVYAINFDGDIKWRYNVWNDSFPPTGFGNLPAVYENKVYIGGDDSIMTCLDAATGDRLWKFKVNAGMIFGAPTIGNEMVYFAGTGMVDTFYALDVETGEVIWEKDKIRQRFTSCIAYNDRIYIKTRPVGIGDPSMLYCLNAWNGASYWKKEWKWFDSSPIMTSNGLVWISGNKLFALSPENGEELFTYSFSDPAYTGFSWPIVYGNMLFVGVDKNLYAFQGSVFDTTKVFLFNYPNPFHSFTVICYSLSPMNDERKMHNLKIYDISGRIVRTLPITQSPNNSITSVVWNGEDNNGKKVASGVYFCYLRTGDSFASKKIIYLK